MKAKMNGLEQWYKQVLRSIARFEIKHPYLTLALVLAITVALMGGMPLVKTTASVEKVLPLESIEVQAFNALRDQQLGQDALAIVVELDRESTTNPGGSILDYEYYQYVKRLDATITKETGVLSVNAYSDVVDAAAQRSGVPVNEQTYPKIISDPEVQTQIAGFINKDWTNTVIVASTDVSTDDYRMNLFTDKIKQDIDDSGKPDAVTIGVTGTPAIQQKLGQTIEHDREVSERFSALFTFIIVALIFGSIVAALTPMVCILLSIAWFYGVLGYLHLSFSTAAGGVAAMVIGIGVDYSIHMRNKFEYERARGSLEHAIEEMMVNTGSVLTVVTIVTVLAFMAFTFAKMPEMGRFGTLMAIGVLCSFLIGVLCLPAFFVVQERIQERILRSKGHSEARTETDSKRVQKEKVHA